MDLGLFFFNSMHHDRRYSDEEKLASFGALSRSYVLAAFYFSDLVTMVEDVVTEEHATSPNKPIYLLGNSFGGCLALAVAARNPHINLVLVLVNPGTFRNKSFQLYEYS